MKKWTYALLFHITIFTSKNVLADCSEISCHGIGEQVVKSVYITNKPDGVAYLQAQIGKEKLKCNLVEENFMTLKDHTPYLKKPTHSYSRHFHSISTFT
ncbi:hypothetical protein [Vibrio litoralis]|uniref:hypothetical protein n=1 Tax=Vibrio litoralis TaxID=335972 RepID=UPI000483EFE7|nr:hypothetical protein [Vibrio litoralis]